MSSTRCIIQKEKETKNKKTPNKTKNPPPKKKRKGRKKKKRERKKWGPGGKITVPQNCFDFTASVPLQNYLHKFKEHSSTA